MSEPRPAVATTASDASAAAAPRAKTVKTVSVAIRTLGRAGQKYRWLLDSIENSTVRPEKVVVVLPDGYELPPERLGWETFVFCPKSMIGQRLAALPVIESDYTLFLDDDIAFPPDFIEKLLSATNEGYACVTGPLFSLFPQSKAGVIAGTLTASVSLSLFSRDKYVKILRSGGWSYHTFPTDEHRLYPTESFSWGCFLIDTELMRQIDMEEERKWLERYGYAAGDDRVMSYKLLTLGARACIVSDALYDHNDAATSRSKDELPSTKPIFCNYFMHRVFWHRFLLSPEKNPLRRLQDCLCHAYWRLAMTGYHLLKSITPGGRAAFRAFREGLKAANAYIRSEDYRALAPIVDKRRNRQ